MNRKISLGDFSGGDLLSKLPKSITPFHLLLMVVGVVLLILTIYFATSYFGAVGTRSDLDSTINLRQQQINNIGGMQNIAALQSQLESAQQDLADKSPFPSQMTNTEIAQSINLVARETAITCYTYTPLSPDTIDINNDSYLQSRYSITSVGAGEATGERLFRIIRFLEELEQAYDTSRVTGLTTSDPQKDGEWTFSFTYSIVSLN